MAAATMESVSTMASVASTASEPIPIPNSNSVGVSVPRTINSLSSAPTRHLPYCPPGSLQDSAVDGLSDSDSDEDFDQPNRSLLYPPDAYEELLVADLPVYSITPDGIAEALDHIAQQPLPPSRYVFPWLHGVNPKNSAQSAFFSRAKCKRPPSCMRSITVVKADGDLTRGVLKGAILPGDIIQQIPRERNSGKGIQTEFLDTEPRSGFSVRNFQYQTVKCATLSDIIVYGENRDVVFSVAHAIAQAQVKWRARMNAMAGPGEMSVPRMNVFVCIAPFANYEMMHPSLVAVDSKGMLTGNVMDLFAQERAEMYEMTQPSEIAPNVWLGPTLSPENENDFDVLIECCDTAKLDTEMYANVATNLPAMEDGRLPIACLEFPGSGSFACNKTHHPSVSKVVEICEWIRHLSMGTLPASARRARAESLSPVSDEDPNSKSAFSDDEDEEGDVPRHLEHVEDVDDDAVTDITDFDDIEPSVETGIKRKILIHCGDGYTETSLLAIAYLSFFTGRPVHEAWLSLHLKHKRNFFAYPTDVTFLRSLACELLWRSPEHVLANRDDMQLLARDEPKWFRAFNGSLPSRVTDYMYLGDLNHANNTDLLRELGITQVLSVGEVPRWPDGELERWGVDKICRISDVQDNGMDTLTHHFERAFQFLDAARMAGKATLVHCRVGVSRSATICIAEIMRTFHLSLPQAYCYVRARRLNVIIQPHLRFAYELLQFEENRFNGEAPELAVDMSDSQTQDKKKGYRREMEWSHLSREIALLNMPFLGR